MERILVAHRKDGKNEYGWIVGFIQDQVVLLRYKDITFTIAYIDEIEWVYGDKPSVGFEDRIDEEIKRYEMSEEERVADDEAKIEENRRKSAMYESEKHRDNYTPSSSTYHYPSSVNNDNTKY